MSLPVYVEIESGVELPHFDADPSEYEWQTKTLQPNGLTSRYKLTEDGRLLRHEQKSREKTDEEKRKEAEEHGFDSWEDYVEAVEQADMEEALENDWPIGIPQENTTDEEWWADHNMHGSFEFHTRTGTITEGEREGEEYYWSYEARFTRGKLDEIVFLGERMGPGPHEEGHVSPESVELGTDD